MRNTKDVDFRNFLFKKKKKAIGVITILYIYHESSIKSFSK